MRGSKFHIRIQAGVVQLKISVKEESVAVSSGVTWESSRDTGREEHIHMGP